MEPYLDDPDHGGHEVNGEGAMLCVVTRHGSALKDHSLPQIVCGYEADVEPQKQVRRKEAPCTRNAAHVMYMPLCLVLPTGPSSAVL